MTTALLSLAALNIAVAVYYTIAAWRLRRAVTRVRLLDVLLTDICARAYIQRHIPIWEAWAGAFGNYEIQVRPVRQEWVGGEE